jgi:hypothetical protein
MAQAMEQQKIDLSDYQSGNTAGTPFAPPASPPPPGFMDTLGREGHALASTLNPVNLVKGVYHAASDPVTAEEKQTYGPTEGANAHWYKPNMENIGPTGRLIVRGVAEPVEHAASFYKDLATASPDKRSEMESAMLDVAPEAAGQAGGTVIGAKGVSTAVNVLRGADPATEIIGERTPSGTPVPFAGATAPVIRGVVRATNAVTQKVPEIAGGALGAGAGELVGGPKAAAIGGAVGAGAGRALRGVIPEVPGEDFGQSTMQRLGVKDANVLRTQDIAAGKTGMSGVATNHDYDLGGSMRKLPDGSSIVTTIDGQTLHLPADMTERFSPTTRPATSEQIARMAQRGILKTPQELGLKPVQAQPTSAAPEVAEVEHIGGAKEGDMMTPAKTTSAPTHEEVNDLAQKEVEKMSPTKPILDTKVEGSLRHIIGDYATDNLIDSPEGAEAAQALKKMSYKQLADTANYEGILKPKSMVSKTGKEWTETDFKRSVAEHGKELNPNKEMVYRHLVDHYGPQDIMDRIQQPAPEEE